MIEPHGQKEVGYEARGKNVVALWDTTYKEYEPLLREMEEDFQFKLGDQWDDATKAKLKSENRPILSLNTLKKAVDIITGFLRKHFSDIHVEPEEDSDMEKADIFSRLIKWTMNQRSNRQHVIYAFDDAVTAGLGWITADISYSKDIINGDIVIGHESPFNVLPDPLFTEPDLSDAKFILRYKWLLKDEIAGLYPNADLSNLKEEDPDQQYIQQPKHKGSKRILVVEKWYRSTTEKTIAILPDAADGEEVIEITSPDHQFQIMQLDPNARIITRQVPIIKLITVAGDGTVLYDGGHPHGTDTFPFFPVFGFYSPSYNDLKLKIQGMVRILKDPQREKNKRRSQSMFAVMSMPFGGMMYEKGFVDNIKSFSVQEGGMRLIEYNPGKKFQQIQPQALPNAMVDLEHMSDQDMRQIGPNPDLLGEQMSKSEPGMNIQMRQTQGFAAIQEFFDNLSSAKENLGLYIISLLMENFSERKMTRILGTPIPEGFVESSKDFTFDCKVDEIAESPTYRMGMFTTLSNMRQQGSPVSDEALIELADLPKELKEKILAPLAEQRQLVSAQTQLQLMQIQMQMDQIAQAQAAAQQQAAQQGMPGQPQLGQAEQNPPAEQMPEQNPDDQTQQSPLPEQAMG